MELPADLSGRFASETDADGQASLAAGAVDVLELFRVCSGAFGVQQLRTPRPDAGGVRTIQLAPAGRVEGRIEAGDPRAVRGLAVRLRTHPDPSADVTGVGGAASTVTDDQGRFSVSAIAVGTLAISFDHRWDLPWRGQVVSRPVVNPGARVEVAIPLKRAALIQGSVQDLDSGQPIPGVGMMLAFEFEPPLVWSDAQGRFSGYLPPGMARAFPAGMPRGYYSPAHIVRTRPLLEGVGELTLEPVGLKRGAELQGRAIDAEGNPTPGAEISGHFDRTSGLPARVHAVADRAGRFRLDGIPPDTALHLSARRGGATTAAPESIPAVQGEVTLTIRPENAIALSGRVKDAAGSPLAGAIARVSARKRGVRDILIEEFAVVFDDEGRSILRTGADGQFRTPRQLRPDLEYQVEAEGYVNAATEWVKPDESRHRYFPAIVLQPIALTRTVAGRVLDTRGRPVAGAIVFQSGDRPARTRTTTGADGRFRLPGVYREPGFLFVEGEGLAFEGHRIGPGEEAIELKVHRNSDPPDPPFRTLPPVLPREEERALAWRLIESDLSPLTGKQTTTETFSLAQTLPRINLELALELAETNAVPSPDYNALLHIECAKALIGENLEEAATIAETLKAPGSVRSSIARPATP